jgi:hypothetical protein
MPSWLERLLPRISIEGEDYFDKRAAPGAAKQPAHAAVEAKA